MNNLIGVYADLGESFILNPPPRPPVPPVMAPFPPSPPEPAERTKARLYQIDSGRSVTKDFTFVQMGGSPVHDLIRIWS
jgi:hypothetical protein